ncbi:MAG TPA: hypothetical protein VE984_09770 [Gaiellaceae bacterium]|nr:hypothetical protein [Gaiellaceae bacterium]
MAASRFDPYAIFHALDRERVFYVLIGGLARVLEGSDEVTRGVDLVPSMRPENLRRLEAALHSLDARPADGDALVLERLDQTRVLTLESSYGQIKLVPEPEGTRGYEDLHRHARHEPLGDGLRIAVASPGDLVRMLSALGRETDELTIETMQRVVELEHELTRGIEL